ncbi:MAG: hypothetical protein OEM97_01400 [Acidimicrobiia bacterium]|nr:hypothetical protein [Acidimicrobiia bacterium]
MSFTIDLTFDAIEIRLGGWDAIRLVRQRLAMPYSLIDSVTVVERSVVEMPIDRRPRHGSPDSLGPQRLGVFTSLDTVGQHYWAVGACGPSGSVVVVDTSHERFTRLVLRPDELEAFVTTLRRQTGLA